MARSRISIPFDVFCEDVLENTDTITVDKEKHYRHNGEIVTVVFKWTDNKYYMATYTWMEDDGIQDYGDVDADECESFEVVRTEWRLKK